MAIAQDEGPRMNEYGDNLTLVLIDDELLTEAQKSSTKTSEKKKRNEKEFMKIRDLEIAIRQMDRELKASFRKIRWFNP